MQKPWASAIRMCGPCRFFHCVCLRGDEVDSVLGGGLRQFTWRIDCSLYLAYFVWGATNASSFRGQSALHRRDVRMRS